MSSTSAPKFAFVTCQELRRAASKFATGIAVVTVTDSDGTPHGMTVNSFTSVSCAPPVVSVSIDLKCGILGVLTQAERFGISVLGEPQQEVSARFAGACDARFEGVRWHAGPGGAPLLDEAIATFECRKHSVIEVGDHLVMFLAVESAEAFDGLPLLYFGSGYGRMGV